MVGATVSPTLLGAEVVGGVVLGVAVATVGAWASPTLDGADVMGVSVGLGVISPVLTADGAFVVGGATGNVGAAVVGS